MSDESPIPHPRSGEHYFRCAKARRPGEDLIDTIKRVAFEDAVEATGSKTAAARLLGISRKSAVNWSKGVGLSLSAPTPIHLGERARQRAEGRKLRDQAVKIGLVS